MTEQTTSLARAGGTRGEWARFAAFLRRPHLPERALPPGGAGALATARMLLLDALIMAVLLAIVGAALASGVTLPKNEIEGLTWTGGTVALVVLFAPLLEEIGFRSWISGRPGHVLAWLAAGLGIGLTFYASGNPVVPRPFALGVLALGLAVAALALYAFRGRGPMGWFQRLAPVLVWASALVFASAHLLNYGTGAGWALGLLVVPQLVVGLILAYVRVQYGLVASIAAHVAHNGLLVGAILAATAFGLG